MTLPGSNQVYPLERYFPPVPQGMVTNWVRKFASPGAYILDPFGQNPFTNLELARAGYRVLVSANNPIAAFVMDVLSSAPTAQEFSQALAALIQNRMRDGSTIEDYIQAFYKLDCPGPLCKDRLEPGKFEVDTFIWSEESSQPVTAVGACTICGLEGEIELTAATLQTQGKTPSYSLIRSQILERIAAQDPHLRRVMEEVVGFYSPRALISLQLLLNKIETSNLDEKQTKLLKALWLSAADQCNQLWIWPRARNRPRQLLRPPMYQEANVWQAFVRGVNNWVHPDPAVKLREWPRRVPPSGGISLFEGRLRELDQKPEMGLISLVQTSLPRRNQAFWNLSGLWSGWLWGKQGIKTIRNSLLRQRYDWTWHSVALKKVLSQLPGLIGADVPVMLLTSELDSLFLLAGTLGAQAAGLELKSASIDGENEMLQTVWKLPNRLNTSKQKNQNRRSFKESGRFFLTETGEPAHWLRLLSFTVADQLVSGGLLNRPGENETLNEVETEFAIALNDVSQFRRFNPGATPETGSYWLAKSGSYSQSLADRTEAVIVQLLQSHTKIGFNELLSHVYSSLPGFSTPPYELVGEILESYSQTIDEDNRVVYQINSHETAVRRSEDLKEIQGLIEQMADKLGYRRETQPDQIAWLDDQGEAEFVFFPITTARFSNILVSNQHVRGQKLVVIPGSRSNLVAYKLKRDPNLRFLGGENWQLVKYRQVRNLAGNPLLSRELFTSQLSSDPPEFHSAQLALF